MPQLQVEHGEVELVVVYSKNLAATEKAVAKSKAQLKGVLYWGPAKTEDIEVGDISKRVLWEGC